MPPANNPCVGATIRRRREQLGLSQRALAKKAQINTGYMSRIEADERVPGASTLVSLATALEMSVGELVGEESTALPELNVYLRAKYDLSDDAIARVADYLRREHGAETGPADGEDETDEPNN